MIDNFEMKWGKGVIDSTIFSLKMLMNNLNDYSLEEQEVLKQYLLIELAKIGLANVEENKMLEIENI